MPKRAGRPSAAQTPAPKSDKIYGSKKNPKGSATEKKAKSIQLSDKTINTLKEKLDTFKKSHPSKKNITLGDLKAVYRRGSGAYSSSHRPTITGGAPNSRAAWSYARVNKFLKKAGGAKVKAAYVQDDDLFAKGGEIELIGKIQEYSNGGADVSLWNQDDDNVGYVEIRYDKVENLLYAPYKLEGIGKKEYISDPQYKILTDDLKKFGIKTSDNIHYIEQIEVYEEFRGKGYASQALRDAIDFYKDEGVDFLLLTVGADTSDKGALTNKNLIEFYKRHGFKLLNGSGNYKNRMILDLKKYAKGGVTKGGDCYEAAGQFCMGFMPEPVEFIGEPHLVHAEVKGQGKAEGIRFGHAWVEDDENVYDYSNGRRIVMPKVVYYAIGDIQTENSLKYQRYTFPEARAKMLKTKHYGSWDIETEYADGGLMAREDYTKDALEFFKKELGIKSDVVLVQSQSSFDPMSMSQLMGSVTPKKDNKFYVAVNFNETKNRFIRVLAHELVHVKQMEDERLRFEGDKIIFDDEKMTYDEYQKRYYSDDIPKHEEEAFNLERVLQNKYAEKENSYSEGGLIAPNGKPSNLTAEQYKLVRTPEFKAWFGDWENDPQNASKVVDENGEPMVVYHGSRSEFTIFDINKSGESSTPAYVGFWFTPIKKFAYNFASTTWYGNSDNINVYPLFLSIKNPKIYNSDTDSDVRYPDSYQKFKIDIWALDGQDADRANVGGMGMMLNNRKETIKKYRELLENEGFDGIFINKTRFDRGEAGGLNDQIVALFPNQIKYADGTNKTFDMNNPDIRYATGGVMADGGLVYKKIYKKGGGGYTTIINGMEYTLNKQYGKGTWVAQSDDGEYYKEAQTLSDLKYYLANIKKDAANPDITYSDGGEPSQLVTCITCINCSWQWETADSAEFDKYVCHQCGFDNSLFYDGGLLKPTMPIDQIAEKQGVSIEYLEEQLNKGMQHEKEHTDSDEVATSIALHHLAERPDYYEEIEKMKLEYGGEVTISDEDYEFAIGGDENLGKAIKQDGKIVGGIAYDEDEQQIYGIVIKNKFRKKGIAKKAIKALFDKNPDLDRVYVRAVPESKGFWKKIGTDFDNYNEDAGLWEGYVKRFEDGGDIDLFGKIDISEDNSQEYEIEDFLKQQKEESHMVMTCDSSKIYKAMICKAKCEIADKRMSETENAEELNAWNSYKNIWNDCLQDIIDNNIEMYKAGGKTCGCGCGSIYSKGGMFSKGGLAYGNSHDKGGMPMKVKSTGQNIEIEGGEGVTNKRSMQMTKKVEFEGQKMTPCEVVSKINEMGGGVKFKCSDVKNIIEEDGHF